MRRWQELRSEFDKRGIQVVTVSADHPEEIKEYRGEHGLDAIMLSDVGLEVTDAFGLRNTEFNSAPPNDDSPALPVPTTLLVDADGRVLWMDISTDYQRRSPPSVMLEAIQTYLDG